MKPIRISCKKLMDLSPEAIMAQIADTQNWSQFSGYGMLPGIEKADYEVRTPAMQGSRIQVKNTDGSSHVEEILFWEDGRRIDMKLYEFSPPLKFIASHFHESWEFSPGEKAKTQVKRSFELYPRFWLTAPFLFLISRIFKKAIELNLKEMESANPQKTESE